VMNPLEQGVSWRLEPAHEISRRGCHITAS
jgi:hypothetical protein